MTIMQDHFENIYLPKTKEFVRDISDSNTSGIPEPHLPHWGEEYEIASIKVGIIGRDTRGWGHMSNFVNAVNTDPIKALYHGKEDFDCLNFTEWTNNFGTTFWDTAIKILAEMHSIDDWRQLKRQKIITPLKRFFWANTNSVERFEVTPQKNRVPWDTWHKVKVASENHLDSFRTILDIFHPHVVFLLHWEPSEHFLDFTLEWKNFGNYQSEAIDAKTGCLILATAHPTWLNQNGLYNEAIYGLLQRAKEKITQHAV